MNKLSTRCPACNARFKVTEAFMGQSVQCLKCRQPFNLESETTVADYPLTAKLAHGLGMITSEQLEALVEVSTDDSQRQTASWGERLRALDWISSEQQQLLQSTERFLEGRPQEMQFGRMALQQGVISPETLDWALNEQIQVLRMQGVHHRIGDILVNAGKMAPTTRDAILARQKRLPKQASDTKSLPPEIETLAELPGAIHLTVSDDAMTAWLVINGSLDQHDQPPGLEQVKALLQQEGIVHGVIEDAQIQRLLVPPPIPAELVMARGQPPQTGQPGQIRFHFDAAFKKVGIVTDTGAIDYKEQGQVPQVSAGTLIAELTPATEGSPGIDVYGRTIQPKPPCGLPLRAGTGVTLSDDGLRAIAAVDGQPQRSLTGKLMVLSELHITGDIGLKTGHVDYQGLVKVDGIVQQGFRVQAEGLEAREIIGAEIKTTGDIWVLGGIIDARIQTQGSIRAKYIKNSVVSAYGDVWAETEIIDAHIVNSGACRIASGKIIASSVSARGGITAHEVGTDVAEPCQLKAGVEQHIDQEVKGLHNAIVRRTDELQHLQQALEDLALKNQNVHREITTMAQIQDRSILEQRQLSETHQSASGAEAAPSPAATEATVSALQKRAQQAEKSLNRLFEQQSELQTQQDKIENRQEQVRAKIEELKQEREAILRWRQSQKPLPLVVVTGTICAGTQIAGVHSAVTLKQNYGNVRIREVKESDPDAKQQWQLRLAQRT